MRVLTLVLVSAATIMAPALASADPAPAQAASAPSAQTVPAPTVTAQTAPAVPVAAASSASNSDEVVCRMTPPMTGSRLGGARECHTAREWNRRQQESQDTLMKAQSLGIQQPLNTLGGSH
jgi:cytochrome c5